jgi:hypothetical protein
MAWKKHVSQSDRTDSPGPIDNAQFLERRNKIEREENEEAEAGKELGEKEGGETVGGFGMLSTLASTVTRLWRGPGEGEGQGEGEEEEGPEKYELREEDKLAFDPLGDDRGNFYMVNKQDWEGLRAMYIFFDFPKSLAKLLLPQRNFLV